MDTAPCTPSGRLSGVKATGVKTVHASKILLLLMLLAGDIHLYPGPSTRETQASFVNQVRPCVDGNAGTPLQLLAHSQKLIEQRHAEEHTAGELRCLCTALQPVSHAF